MKDKEYSIEMTRGKVNGVEIFKTDELGSLHWVCVPLYADGERADYWLMSFKKEATIRKWAEKKGLKIMNKEPRYLCGCLIRNAAQKCPEHGMSSEELEAEMDKFLGSKKKPGKKLYTEEDMQSFGKWLTQFDWEAIDWSGDEINQWKCDKFLKGKKK